MLEIDTDTTVEQWTYRCDRCSFAKPASRADLMCATTAWPQCLHCAYPLSLDVRLERGALWAAKTYLPIDNQPGVLGADYAQHDIRRGYARIEADGRALEYALARAAFARNDVRVAVPAAENTPERKVAIFRLVCFFASELIREASERRIPLEYQTLQYTARWIAKQQEERVV